MIRGSRAIALFTCLFALACQDPVTESDRRPACETLRALCPSSDRPSCTDGLDAWTNAECLAQVRSCATQCQPERDAGNVGADTGGQRDGGRNDASPDIPIEEPDYLQIGAGFGDEFRPWRDGDTITAELGGQGSLMIVPTIRFTPPEGGEVTTEGYGPPAFWFFPRDVPGYNPFDSLQGVYVRPVTPENFVAWVEGPAGTIETGNVFVPFGRPSSAPEAFRVQLHITVPWMSAFGYRREIELTLVAPPSGE